jgi:hypothetical protein
LAIWHEASIGLDPAHHSRFCEKVGLADKEASLYVLSKMSKRLRFLHETLGEDLAVWLTPSVVSMLPDVAIQDVLNSYRSCRHMDARELLFYFTEGGPVEARPLAHAA